MLSVFVCTDVSVRARVCVCMYDLSLDWCGCYSVSLPVLCAACTGNVTLPPAGSRWFLSVRGWGMKTCRSSPAASLVPPCWPCSGTTFWLMLGISTTTTQEDSLWREIWRNFNTQDTYYYTCAFIHNTLIHTHAYIWYIHVNTKICAHAHALDKYYQWI